MSDPLARVQARTADGVVEITLEGEVDLSNADALEQQIVDAARAGAEVRLDLQPVTYLDSRGIRLLVNVARRLDAEGVTLDVVAPRSSIAGGVLRLTNVDELKLDDS